MKGRTTDEAGEISGYTRPVEHPAPHPLLVELRRIRLNGGWTVDDLARRLYVHRRSIHNWEAGDHQPRIETLVAYADALGYELVLRRRVFEVEPVAPAQAKEHRAVLASALGIVDDYESAGGDQGAA